MRRAGWPSFVFGLGLIVAVGGVPGVTGPGIETAQASEFYSRRRVNGVWQTGQFSKAEVDGELRKLGVGPRTEARPRRATWSRDSGRSRRTGWARPRFQRSALRDRRGPDDLIAGFMAAAPLGALSLPAIDAPSVDRPDAGTTGHGLANPQGFAAVPAEPQAEAPETRREHLRSALEAKARELATATARPEPEAPKPAPAADVPDGDLQPVTSTYDYRTHVRTTVYRNGVVLRETLSGPEALPVVTRRFVGMEFPRPTGGVATAAR